MVTKVINIEVRDGDLNDLNRDLNKVEKNFKDVERSADKTSSSLKDVGENGGAIALLDELTGGLATKIRDAAEASKLFNFSLKGTRTALIATGIGAFVVAVGTLVAYWSDIKDFITGSNTELENQINLQNEILLAAERELQILDKQDNILKLQGKTQSEINKQKKEALKIVIQEAEEQLLLAKQRLEELQQIKNAGGSGLESFLRGTQVILNSVLKIVDEFFKKIGLNTDFAGTQFSVSESLLEGIFGTQEEIDQATERVETLEDKILDARNRLAGITLSELDNNVRQEREFTEIGVLSTNQLAEIENEKLVSDLKIDILANELQQKELLDKLSAEQRLQTASNLLNSLGALAEQGSVGAKAIAITQAVISTYQGINKALAETTDFTPTQTLRFANAAAVGLAGFANVANILKANPSGSARPSISGVGGGGGVSAPSFNVVGTSGVNQLAESLQQDQEPIQAYVVANNVTSAQSLNNNIVETASIG